MPALAAPALYAFGFVLATALLHAAGVAGGLSLLGSKRWEAALRLSGAAISSAGVFLLLGVC
jgi:urease accessory protein